MSNRYWVGGTGIWGGTNTANWASVAPVIFTASCSGLVLTTTGSPTLVIGMTVWSDTNASLGTITGGSGNIWAVSVGGTYASQTMSAATTGFSIPTAANADIAFFQVGTTYTVTLSGVLTCAAISVTAGTVTFAGTGSMGILNSLSLSSGTVWNGTGVMTFNGASAGITTAAGTVMDCPITYNPINTTDVLDLNSNLTVGSTRTFTLTKGTLNLNSFILTTGIFASSNTNVRNINFNTGKIVVNGSAVNIGTIANLTTSTSTANKLIEVVSTAATTITMGAVVETVAMDFTVNSGGITYLLTLGSGSFRNLIFNGFPGTISSSSVTIYGNIDLGDLSSPVANSSTTWTFASTSSKNITSRAKVFGMPLTFNGIGGEWVLQDDMTLLSTRALTHTNGKINLNAKTLTVGTTYVTGIGTKDLTFNGGILVCPSSGVSAFNNAQPANYTTTAGTGTGQIQMTAATAKTFIGGATGSTVYNCTLVQAGAGVLTITGNASPGNTFNDITSTQRPATITFTSGNTNTFNNFSVNGTAGNLVTINSTVAGSQHTLTKVGGVVSCNYLSIRDSNATPATTWYAGTTSTNVSNNTGWIFTAPPTGAYSITALNGSYTVSGQTATISRNRALTASNGNYSITGQNTSLDFGRVLAASNGNYVVTGQSATLVRGRVLTASNGSYGVTGQSATVSFGRLLSAQNGVYSVAGQVVDISVGIPPTPVTAIDLFAELRSFTERRRFF